MSKNEKIITQHLSRIAYHVTMIDELIESNDNTLSYIEHNDDINERDNTEIINDVIFEMQHIIDNKQK